MLKAVFTTEETPPVRLSLISLLAFSSNQLLENRTIRVFDARFSAIEPSKAAVKHLDGLKKASKAKSLADTGRVVVAFIEQSSHTIFDSMEFVALLLRRLGLNAPHLLVLGATP